MASWVAGQHQPPWPTPIKWSKMDPGRKGWIPEAPLPPHTRTKPQISNDATEPEQWAFYAVQAADLRPSRCFSAPPLLLFRKRSRPPPWNGSMGNVSEVVNICTHLAIIAGRIWTDFPAPGSQAQAIGVIELLCDNVQIGKVGDVSRLIVCDVVHETGCTGPGPSTNLNTCLSL